MLRKILLHVINYLILFSEKIKELNETLLKFPESQGIKICKEDVQFS